eukprot:SAG31_NODE_2108_length_6427_cov_7.816688_4_plen_129_part_00
MAAATGGDPRPRCGGRRRWVRAYPAGSTVRRGDAPAGRPRRAASLVSALPPHTHHLPGAAPPGDMVRSRVLAAAAALASIAALAAAQQHQQHGARSFYDLSAIDIDGNHVDFARFRGQVSLVVNVASY